MLQHVCVCVVLVCIGVLCWCISVSVFEMPELSVEE